MNAVLMIKSQKESRKFFEDAQQKLKDIENKWRIHAANNIKGRDVVIENSLIKSSKRQLKKLGEQVLCKEVLNYLPENIAPKDKYLSTQGLDVKHFVFDFLVFVEEVVEKKNDFYFIGCPEETISSQNKKRSLVVSIEGPQGSGKTTQMNLLNNKYAISTQLNKDPAQLMKEFELSQNEFMFFPQRQELARRSLDYRYKKAALIGELIFLDRSIYTANMLHYVTGNLRRIDKMVLDTDLKILKQWHDINNEYDFFVVILMLNDIFHSFARMKEDKSMDNRHSNFLMHFVECVFYESLSYQVPSMTEILWVDGQDTSLVNKNILKILEVE